MCSIRMVPEIQEALCVSDYFIILIVINILLIFFEPQFLQLQN